MKYTDTDKPIIIITSRKADSSCEHGKRNILQMSPYLVKQDCQVMIA